jgi:hypothetical protein
VASVGTGRARRSLVQGLRLLQGLRRAPVPKMPSANRAERGAAVGEGPPWGPRGGWAWGGLGDDSRA